MTSLAAGTRRAHPEPAADAGNAAEEFLAAALACDAVRPVVDEQDPSAVDCLLPVMSLLLGEAHRRLGAGLAGTDDVALVAASRRALETSLGRRLVRIAARTLVYELQAGDPHPDHGFDDFVARTAAPTGLRALLTRYPVLARRLAVSCLDAVDALVEFGRRWTRDRHEVRELLLGGGDSTILTIGLGAGDLHCRGRSVAVVQCRGGRVVYKPRALDAAAGLRELFELLSARRPDLRLRAPAVLVRSGYGWEEFVAAQPCSDEGGLERFHQRVGSLLAVLHVLDATDMHCQNIVAHGEYPVVVDAETLFHPTVSGPGTADDDPATAEQRDSVLRTGLLPLVVRGEHGLADFSGLFGGRASDTVDDVVDWVDAGTSRMRMIRRRAVIPAAQNTPWIDGRPAPELDHTHASAVLTGFRTAYLELLARRDEVAARVAAFDRVEVRLVLRPTRLYVTLLDEATHPDLLHDRARYDAALSSIVSPRDSDVLRALRSAELAELRDGDVPLFRALAGDREVTSTRPGHGHAVLAESGTSRALAGLAAAGPADLERQLWFIEAGFAGRGQPIAHRPVHRRTEDRAARDADPEQLLAQACGIADELLSRCSRGADGRINWLGVEPADGRHWELRPMGAGLADGYTGVAVFLASIGRATGIARFLDHARAALVPIPGLLALLEGDPSLALAVGDDLLTGMRGVQTALAANAELLADGEVAGWAQRCATVRSAAGLTGTDTTASTAAVTGRAPATWCAGLPALLVPGAPWAQLLERLRADGPLDQQSLCHGELGVLEALRMCATDPRIGADAEQLRRDRLVLLTGDLATRGLRCGTIDSVRTPGLLHGSAGIGLALVNQARAGSPPYFDLLRAVRPESATTEENR